MQIINKWLTGQQNFIIGAALYKTFGSDQKLKDLLAKGETPTARRLLTEAVQKLSDPSKTVTANLLVDKIQPKNETKHPEVVILQNPGEKALAEMPETTDPVLESLRVEWLLPYQRMNLLRHELDKFGNDNGWEAIAWRQPRARDIKKLEQKCIAVWAKRDHYIKEGKLPFFQEAKLEIPTDPIELANLISNIKKYIRRYSKAMRDEPGNPRNADLYVQYKAQHLQVTGEEYIEKKGKRNEQKN